jgi:hypothetical protein
MFSYSYTAYFMKRQYFMPKLKLFCNCRSTMCAFLAHLTWLCFVPVGWSLNGADLGSEPPPPHPPPIHPCPGVVGRVGGFEDFSYCLVTQAATEQKLMIYWFNLAERRHYKNRIHHGRIKDDTAIFPCWKDCKKQLCKMRKESFSLVFAYFKILIRRGEGCDSS